MCKYAGSSTQPCQAGGTTQFLWDVAGSLPLLLKDGTTSYIYDPSGLPLEQINGSTTLWFHHDQLGSTRLVTNSTGVSQATYTYDPYGGLASSTGSTTNPFRFSGQYLDSESGLYYLRARYYESATGQFVTRDPEVSSTGEPYAYVLGNPLNSSDPSGLWPDWKQIWNAATQLPAAVARSIEYDAESIASSLIDLPYAAAFEFNRQVAPHIPQPLRAPLETAALGVQVWSLHNDEAFDRFEASTGYPGTTCPPENDEGQPVHLGPSFFYPSWTGTHWKQNKVEWGPPSPSGEPMGRDSSGKEHYAT